MPDPPMQNEPEPKKQLESDHGGSGHKGKTGIGTGEGGDSGDGGNGSDSDYPGEWPDEPNLASRPRTVICDSDATLRAKTKAMIEPFVAVVGEASDGRAAMEIIRRLSPNLLITEVNLDEYNGVDICRLTQGSLKTNVIIQTDSYYATKYCNQLIRAGALGFCLKSSGRRALFAAMENVTRNQQYVDPKISELVRQVPHTIMPNCTLTEQEVEVLIRLDLRDKEIAEELDMKLRTVQKHVEIILAKLAVPTRIAAAAKAVKLGYMLLPRRSDDAPEE